MMVQFNLLPDIKLEFVKARQLNHTIRVVALIVSAVAVAIALIAFSKASITPSKNNLVR